MAARSFFWWRSSALWHGRIPPSGPGHRHAIFGARWAPWWSVILEERPVHPFLAEYDYRLQVFYSEDRYGEYRGTVDLVINPGGRTFLCLYSLTAANRAPLLEVADRLETSIVDLQAHRRLPRAPKGYKRRFVGAFVEEAYPLRFVPAQIEPICPSDR